MTIRSCSHEKDVAELLKRGQWPGLAPAEMRVHVTECASCRDLTAVAQAFQKERVVASAMARLESPGVLWWRAQLRKRNAALKQVNRPMVAAQVFAVVLGVIAILACLALAGRSGSGWIKPVAELPSALHISAMLPETWQNTPAPWLVLLTIAALAVMGGVFVYKASEER
ncbi:hypothetical protein [Terracidiphilus gabretensis]|jgi:hypothetical protein|uniref:hypothetical protein n=1 Tax=Terracidiphilus gabretensis TaxID=1577687 RepID=UPI00071B70C0|nr:hypothetical protein [Terracidiphilus gabretensis]